MIGSLSCGAASRAFSAAFNEPRRDEKRITAKRRRPCAESHRLVPETLLKYVRRDIEIHSDRKSQTMKTKMYCSSLQILAAGICWGCIGLFSRTLLNAGIGAANVVVLRNLGSLLVLLAVFAVKDRSVFHIRLRHLPIFFGTGVISVVLFTLCYFRCQELCSLAVSAILLYMAPAMVVVMSAVVFRERITAKKIAALVLALFGCFFVTGIWNGGLSMTLPGILFGLGAAFFYALYSIFSRFGLRHYGSFTVVMWTFVFAGLASLLLLDWPAMKAVLSRPGMWRMAAGIILLSTVAPYLLYTSGLQRVESGKASILASVEPVTAAFVGILAFGEPASLPVFAGLACILACVLILR